MATEMVEVEQDAGQIVKLPPQPGSLLRAMRQRSAAIETSIATGTPAGEQAFIRCLSKADSLAKHCINRPLVVADWLAHEIELVDQQSGEVNAAVRLVLVLDDGKTVSTTSNSLIKGWFDSISLLNINGYTGPYALEIGAVPVQPVGEYLQVVKCGRVTTASKTAKK